MADTIYFKQHLGLSLEGQVKNFRVEILEEEPPKEEWRLGRIWYNKKIGQFQTNTLKLDKTSNMPVQPEEIIIETLGRNKIGLALDEEYYPDGLFDFNTQTKISNAVDEMNEALKDIAPPEGTNLSGDLILKSTHYDGKIPRTNNRLNLLSPGNECAYIFDNHDIKFLLPEVGKVIKKVVQKQFAKADQGIITLYINNNEIGSINLGENFNELSREYDGSKQGYNPPIEQTVINHEGENETLEINPNKEKYIDESKSFKITYIEKYNDFKKWQIGSGEIQLREDLLVLGENNIYVKHTVNDKEYKTNIFTIFIDTNKNITINSIDFKLENEEYTYISGIPYIKKCDIKLSSNVDNLFSTYYDHPLSIKSNFVDNIDIHFNEGQGLENLEFPNEDANFNFEKTIQNSSKKTILDNLYIDFMFKKPIFNVSDKKSIKRLFNTYGIESTNTKELFLDEQYRLKNIDFDNVDEILNYTWDSTKDLNKQDALLFLGRLEKANKDFSIYNIDKSYNNDDVQYYYRYIKDNEAHSNGKLKIKTNGEIGKDFDVYIKIPGVTGFLNINKSYDYQNFENNYNIDGTGNMINKSKHSGTYYINYTFGTKSTAESNNLYIIKIALKNNIEIYEIEEIGW